MAADAQVRAIGLRCRKLFVFRRVVAQVFVGRIREHSPIALHVAFNTAVVYIADAVEPMWICDWQRFQQHFMDKSKDRCIGANPQRKRDDGGKTEDGSIAQLPESITKVLEKDRHGDQQGIPGT